VCTGWRESVSFLGSSHRTGPLLYTWNGKEGDQVSPTACTTGVVTSDWMRTSLLHHHLSLIYCSVLIHIISECVCSRCSSSQSARGSVHLHHLPQDIQGIGMFMGVVLVVVPLHQHQTSAASQYSNSNSKNNRGASVVPLGGSIEFQFQEKNDTLLQMLLLLRLFVRS